MNPAQTVTRITTALSALVIRLALANQNTAAEEPKTAFPGTDAGAQSLLEQFVKPGADLAVLSNALRPTPADYEAVFEPEVAAKVVAMYDPAWDAGKLVVTPKAGQSVVELASATTDEMKSWSGTAAAEFPGGWKKIGAKMKAGLTIYRFKFLEPDKDAGMTYDGLIHVNGNWRIFPKAWRALGN